MTLDELIARESVRDTYARYNHAGDRGRVAELAECFTEDGVLEVKDRFAAHGRSEIAAVLGEVAAQFPRTDAPPPGTHHIMRHYVANLLFTSIGPDRIHSEAYFAVFLVDTVDHWGRYRDELVPVDGRWLFARRLVSVDGKRPGSTA
jgi:SnoaL-like protein